MSKNKVFFRQDDKVVHEFYCTYCSGYITVKLRMDFDGAHIIECPSCSHEHYRIIDKGEITEDRAPGKHDAMHRIKAPMSAYSKTSWEQIMKKKRQSTKAQQDPGGFLTNSWKRLCGKGA